MAFLVPFVTGALTELEIKRKQSDARANDIISNVGEKVLNEIDQEEKLIQKANSFKKQYAINYGEQTAAVLDSAGVFDNPTDVGINNALIRFFGTEKYNLDNFKTKVESKAKEDPKNFEDLTAGSFIGTRKTNVRERKDFVADNFSNTPNVRDLLLSDKQKEYTGVRKLILGDRIEAGQETSATSNLLEATKVNQTELPTISTSFRDEFGITLPKEAESFYTKEDIFKLKDKALTEFNNNYKNPITKSVIESNFKPKKGVALEEYNKLPAADKRKYLLEQYQSDYINRDLQTQVEQNVPGAANELQTRNLNSATRIAQQALQRINDLEELSKTSSIPDNTGTNAFDPYDATLDIEKIRSLAKQQIINLGIDPTDVGI